MQCLGLVWERVVCQRQDCEEASNTLIVGLPRRGSRSIAVWAWVTSKEYRRGEAGACVTAVPQAPPRPEVMAVRSLTQLSDKAGLEGESAKGQPEATCSGKWVHLAGPK